jgi:phosphohistidine phosphatase
MLTARDIPATPMRLLIVRHAVAVDHGTPGFSDDERPLTPEGEKKFKKAARGLARVTPRPDAILSSPLPRAFRTAEIAAAAWGKVPPPLRTQALAFGSFEDVAEALKPYGPDSLVALFGHEPHLSELLARLLGLSASSRVAFRKGGAALVEVAGDLQEGANLLFFAPPSLLRDLGD